MSFQKTRDKIHYSMSKSNSYLINTSHKARLYYKSWTNLSFHLKERVKLATLVSSAMLRYYQILKNKRTKSKVKTKENNPPQKIEELMNSE